jgi:pyrimidine deaminase RibD-like protein
MISNQDTQYLRLAVELADRSPPTARSFSVGAVIVSGSGKVVATGFTREYGPDWHAEEVAIEKARRKGASLAGCVLYSSIEPCGRRLSGRTPCADHIIASGISRVVYCLDEPPVFVRPSGRERLIAAGITVDRDARLASLVLHNNREALQASRSAK